MRLIYPRNKGFFLGVVTVLLFILIVLTIIAFTPAGNLQTKNTAPTPTPKAVDLCSPFTTNKKEVSCEEAIRLALARFPGKVTSIEKKSSSVPAEKDPLPNTIPQNPPEPASSRETISTIPNPPQRPSVIKFNNEVAWVVSVNADHKILYPDGKSTNIFDVIVSTEESKILVAYPKFQK